MESCGARIFGAVAVLIGLFWLLVSSRLTDGTTNFVLGIVLVVLGAYEFFCALAACMDELAEDLQVAETAVDLPADGRRH
jgi:apolipoprotein N-acyltransferase